MLKIAIHVRSGIQNIVVPQKDKGSYLNKFKLKFEPANRHKFLQGILLYLMGERVSLYALDREYDDEFWQEQRVKLNEFLAHVELKGCIKLHQSNYDLMTFTQHRKHGVPMYGNHQFEGNELKLIGDDDSRLNERYEPFIQDGLFDVFCIHPEAATSLLKLGCWKTTQKKLIVLLSQILDDDSAFNDKNLTLDNAKKIKQQLSVLFNPLTSQHCAYSGDDVYRRIIDVIGDMDTPLKNLKFKKSGYKLKPSERTEEQQQCISETLALFDANKIVFSYFMWRYLAMYVDLHDKQEKIMQCTSFGLKSLNYKSKAGIGHLCDWLKNPLDVISDKASQNSRDEFYKGVFKASKYGVSTRAPVLTKRYDGDFELYIQAPRELELIIQQRIEQSNRWYLRVGKLSLGRMTRLPERIPSMYWSTIEDDTVETRPLR